MPRVVRKGLTKAKILEESQALIDGGGAPALTMRSLGARLGVAPMAFYNHFHDRDAILDALADSVFARLREQAAEAGRRSRSGTNWKRRLKTLLLSAQQFAAQHPHVFRVAFTRPNKPSSAFALTDDSIRILEQAGLNQAQALTVFHTFVILLQGYPFWQEGMSLHGGNAPPEFCLPQAPKGWTAERQFAAIIDWLLHSVETMAQANSGARKRPRRMR